jgi:hypothetical protein
MEFVSSAIIFAAALCGGLLVLSLLEGILFPLFTGIMFLWVFPQLYGPVFRSRLWYYFVLSNVGYIGGIVLTSYFDP